MDDAIIADWVERELISLNGPAASRLISAHFDLDEPQGGVAVALAGPAHGRQAVDDGRLDLDQPLALRGESSSGELSESRAIGEEGDRGWETPLWASGSFFRFRPAPSIKNLSKNFCPGCVHWAGMVAIGCDRLRLIGVSGKRRASSGHGTRPKATEGVKLPASDPRFSYRSDA
jgi:hypothetical protein